jgi:hypothetical protein
MAPNLTGGKMRKPVAALVAVAALALVAAGCGSNSSSSSSSGHSSSSTTTPTKSNPKTAEASPAGDIPDNQAYVAYSPSGAGFAIKVPEGWAQAKAANVTTFTDKLNSISVEVVPAKAALTAAEAKKVDLAKLSLQKGFSAQGVSAIHRNAGTAVRIKYMVDSKPDPVTGKVTKDAVERYVFFHNGKRVVLTLSGPKGADNVDPWKIVTNSVRWTA